MRSWKKTILRFLDDELDDDWMAKFDFDHSTGVEQRKSVSSLFIGHPQKKQHCYHGAFSHQKKDLLTENVSFVREITTISIQILRF
jgi:hypothetical protein